MAEEQLADTYEGERIFLIGNGPSLAETPLDELDGEYSMAMNGVNFIYDETDWRPTFYLFTQGNFEQTRREHVEENVDSGATCFIDDRHRDVFGDRDNVHYVTKRELKFDPVDNQRPLHEIELDTLELMEPDELWRYWSDDPVDELYTYHSMYGAIQLAVYMGFDQLYLLGCDLGFQKHNPYLLFENGLDPVEYGGGDDGVVKSSYREFLNDARNNDNFVRSIANGAVFKLGTSLPIEIQRTLLGRLRSEADPNHFDSQYRLRPKDNRYANLEITKSHVVAKSLCKELGVDIYNATVGGELGVYFRRDIHELIN